MQRARLLELFSGRMSRFKGTNQPVEYRPEYNFSESWEEASKSTFETNHNRLLSTSTVGLFLAVVVMVHKVPLIWYLSVWGLFSFTPNYFILGSGLLMLCLDVVLKLGLFWTDYKKYEARDQRKKEMTMEIIELVYGDVVAMIVLIVDLSFHSSSPLQVLLDGVAIVLQFWRFMEIYNSIVILLIATQYKHHLTLFGFVSKLFVIVHFTVLSLSFRPFSSTQSA